MVDYEEEIVTGKLKEEPYLKYTNTGKKICNAILETSEEDLRLIAWEEQAIEFNSFKKHDIIEVVGYRKYNDYIKKEEFVVKSVCRD